MEVARQTYAYRVENETLTIILDNNEFIKLDLVPVINDKLIGVVNVSADETLITIETDNPKLIITLAFEEDSISYSVAGPEDMCDRVTYFPDSKINFETIHPFIPDYFSNYFPAVEDYDLVVSPSISPKKQRAISEDQDKGQSWMFAPQPRAISFHRGKEIMGLSIPDILPVAETHFKFKGGRFHIDFEKYYSANKKGAFPAVKFHFGLKDAYDALQKHRENNTHLIKMDKDYFTWWSRPIYCTWGEQCQLGQEWDMTKSKLTADNIREWVGIIEEKTGMTDFTVVIDYPWFDKYGDFDASVNRLGGDASLRALIDELHAKGHKVQMWITPFKVSKGSKYSEESLEGLYQDPDSEVDYKRDYSVERNRKHVEGIIRKCLSPDEDGFDADGFKIDFNFECPNAKNEPIADPAWGVGDQYWYNVVKLFYDTSKSIKKDAFLSLSSAECYVQPFVDVLRLNDHFPDNVDFWYERARIGVEVVPDTMLDVDDWYMVPKKADEYWIVSPAYGIPVMYYTTMFEYKQPISTEYYRLLKATWQVYMNSPAEPSMDIEIDYEKSVFTRKYTQGPLKDFYSAIVLDKNVLCTYCEGKMLVASTANRKVTLPLPPNKNIVKIENVMDDGSKIPVEAKTTNEEITLTVSDARQGTLYVEVTLA